MKKHNRNLNFLQYYTYGSNTKAKYQSEQKSFIYVFKWKYWKALVNNFKTEQRCNGTVAGITKSKFK